MSSNMQIGIKIRPPPMGQKDEPLWMVKDKNIGRINKTQNFIGEPYSFDHIFDDQKSNKDVYDAMVKPLVMSCLEGINSTIFAYGQTSSGKTYTMLGDENIPGIISFTVEDIFTYVDENTTKDFLLRCSYLEIYNEKINDLLDTNSTDLLINEDSSQGVYVRAKEEVIREPSELFNLMKKGMKRRKIGSTDMNKRSSRSHAILRLVLQSQNKESEGSYTISTLSLVDLAGSERVGQSNMGRERHAEGVTINKSLTTLGLVIQQLSENDRFINYRDSKLTRLLKQSLGGNSNTLIIATINTAVLEETKSTLEFAKRAKYVKNRPIINERVTDKDQLKHYQNMCEDYKEQMEKLKNTIKALEGKISNIQLFSKRSSPNLPGASKIPPRRHTDGYYKSQGEITTTFDIDESSDNDNEDLAKELSPVKYEERLSIESTKNDKENESTNKRPFLPDTQVEKQVENSDLVIKEMEVLKETCQSTQEELLSCKQELQQALQDLKEKTDLYNTQLSKALETNDKITLIEQESKQLKDQLAKYLSSSEIDDLKLLQTDQLKYIQQLEDEKGNLIKCVEQTKEDNAKKIDDLKHLLDSTKMELEEKDKAYKMLLFGQKSTSNVLENLKKAKDDLELKLTNEIKQLKDASHAYTTEIDLLKGEMQFKDLELKKKDKMIEEISSKYDLLKTELELQLERRQSFIEKEIIMKEQLHELDNLRKEKSGFENLRLNYLDEIKSLSQTCNLYKTKQEEQANELDCLRKAKSDLENLQSENANLKQQLTLCMRNLSIDNQVANLITPIENLTLKVETTQQEARKAQLIATDFNELNRKYKKLLEDNKNLQTEHEICLKKINEFSSIRTHLSSQCQKRAQENSKSEKNDNHQELQSEARSSVCKEDKGTQFPTPAKAPTIIVEHAEEENHQDIEEDGGSDNGDIDGASDDGDIDGAAGPSNNERKCLVCTSSKNLTARDRQPVCIPCKLFYNHHDRKPEPPTCEFENNCNIRKDRTVCIGCRFRECAIYEAFIKRSRSNTRSPRNT